MFYATHMFSKYILYISFDKSYSLMFMYINALFSFKINIFEKLTFVF